MENKSSTVTSEMRKNKALADSFFSKPQNLPLSFRMDGKIIRGIPESWEPKVEKRFPARDRIETVYSGSDPETGLSVRVECVEYSDFPVLEWVVWFCNEGNAPTHILSEILGADLNLSCVSPSLYHSSGDFCSAEGYIPRRTPLGKGDILHFATRCGRACDDVFPYFRILSQGEGYSMAVGWPGQWHCEFQRSPDGVRVTCGQENTYMRLMPKEKIRTPKITLLSFFGDEFRAVNLWRRWYLAHILPRSNGDPVKPMLACSGTDEGEEYTAATEENQLKYMKKYVEKGIDFDVWWIDAGWYPCTDKKENRRRWFLTGTWQPDPVRFPEGFRKISEYADKKGAKLLVWFEPERVTKGSRLYSEHPEWLLKSRTGFPSGYVTLLNLGNIQCREWLTNTISKTIQENGIRIYRQDYNIDPLPFWRENDAVDRQGITENLYIQGYLQYWDDLRAQNPGLIIDSCASGGRRNDLETMRRSVPLHYSDYGYGEHPVKLAFHHTMYAWLPYFKDVDLSYDQLEPGEEPNRYSKKIDRFGFHCGMAPMFFLGIDIRRDDYDFGTERELIGLWRRASSFILYGDYYPLTAFGNTGDQWVSWQFDDEKTGKGLIQGMRHANCPEDRLTVRLHALNPNCNYLFENPETKEALTFSGKKLIDEGFTFELPKRSASMWFYSSKC